MTSSVPARWISSTVRRPLSEPSWPPTRNRSAALRIRRARSAGPEATYVSAPGPSTRSSTPDHDTDSEPAPSNTLPWRLPLRRTVEPPPGRVRASSPSPPSKRRGAPSAPRTVNESARAEPVTTMSRTAASGRVTSAIDGSRWWIVIVTPSDEIVASPLRSTAHVVGVTTGAGIGSVTTGARSEGAGAAAAAASAIGSLVAAGGVVAASVGAAPLVVIGLLAGRHRRRGEVGSVAAGVEPDGVVAAGASSPVAGTVAAGVSVGSVAGVVAGGGVAVVSGGRWRRVAGGRRRVGGGRRGRRRAASRPDRSASSMAGRRSRTASGVVTGGSAAISVTTTGTTSMGSTAWADAPSENPRAMAAATAVEPIARNVRRSQRRGAASSVGPAMEARRGRRRASASMLAYSTTTARTTFMSGPLP